MRPRSGRGSPATSWESSPRCAASAARARSTWAVRSGSPGTGTHAGRPAANGRAVLAADRGRTCWSTTPVGRHAAGGVRRPPARATTTCERSRFALTGRSRTRYLDRAAWIALPGSRCPDRAARIALPGSRCPDRATRCARPGPRCPDREVRSSGSDPVARWPGGPVARWGDGSVGRPRHAAPRVLTVGIGHGYRLARCRGEQACSPRCRRGRVSSPGRRPRPARSPVRCSRRRRPVRPARTGSSTPGWSPDAGQVRDARRVRRASPSAVI